MRTAPRKGAWAVMLCLSLALLMVAAPRSAYTLAGGPLCVESQSQPVLQDTGWYQYSSSPIIWDHTTFYDGAFVMKQGAAYTMYLREQANNTPAIYRGVSSDGINWVISPNPVLTTGPKGTWDSSVVFSPNVIWNGSEYLMYYVGSGNTSSATFPANFRQIGVAFSSDGVHWTKYSGNPVIRHGPGA